MPARMRTTAAQPLLIGIVTGCLVTATGIAVLVPVREAPACVVELQPIQETRQITVLTWPVPDSASPIQAPRLAIKRRKMPLIPTAPVEQCTPASAGERLPDDFTRPIPEPGSLALMGIGGAALFIVRRSARRIC